MSIKDSVETAWFINTSVSYQFPLADMKARYGNSTNINLGFGKKNKKNIYWGIDGGMFFGNTLNESALLLNLVNSGGYIIAEDGTPADIVFTERGLYFKAQIGKIVPLFHYNKNSGLMMTFGAGYIQHKIRIEPKVGVVPALEKPYNKGYDRLCSGLLLTQQVGYLFMHNKKKFNFFAGVEIMEGFTKSRRTVDYDTGLYNDKKRLDILVGPKVTWILPIYTNVEKKIYYK